MTHKRGANENVVESSTSTTPEEVGKIEDDFEHRLASLPEQYREEILRQYDLPTCKATLLTILGYATWVEVLLMIAGTLLSICAGIYYPNDVV